MREREGKTDSRAASAELDVTTFSNGVRLTGWQWLGVGLFAALMVLFVPSLWQQVEKFDLEPDYRMPHDLSQDYWLYERYARLAASHYDTVLIGDSVIWGEYVTRQQTLSHCLNELAGEERFANLGLDGASPLALTGLVEHYAGSISDKNVVLHCNLLWMSSPGADFQDEKAPQFNSHPRLVPQFVPRIPSYKEEISQRIGVLVEQRAPFASWTNHLQQAYFDRTDIPSWTLEHPDENPLQPGCTMSSWFKRILAHPFENPFQPLTRGLPPSDNSLRQLPLPWYKTGKTKQDYPWVDLESSLQWAAFRRTIEILQQRNNRVFVLVGPFNEHMLNEKSLEEYQKVKDTIVKWLGENNVVHVAGPALASELYGDASHPLSAGYQALAGQVFENFFQQKLLAGAGTVQR